MPSETAHKLRELSERLRHYAGDFKEHVPPMEKLTDKMRVLADDLNHADSEHPTEWIVEQAENVGLMLGIIYSDVALDTEMCGPDHPRSRRKAILTEEESETKSYITQALIILDHIVLGKTWSETCPGDLRYFADQLDKCPPVMQYRKFWNMLKLTKVDAEIKKQKTKAAGNDGTSNTYSKNFRSVTWYGRTYTFNKNQAIAVKLLWNAMERDESGIHQNTIAESLDTVSKKFRLLEIFRQHGKTHPAWSEMIYHSGNGVYILKKLR